MTGVPRGTHRHRNPAITSRRGSCTGFRARATIGLSVIQTAGECAVIFRSPYPEVSIPEVSFSDFLLDRCHVHGEAPAFVDGLSGRVLTFAQLAELAESFAAGLTAQGLESGAVVAILSPNIPEYAVVVIGAIRA